MSELVPAAGALQLCEASIQQHSKSFSMASRLLPPGTREDVVVLYAWCRRADDAVDDVAPRHQRQELRRLQVELEQIYSGSKMREPALEAFQDMVQRRNIPLHYPDELLRGMEMDVDGASYASLDDLLLYCYRVAGVVGLMMCHLTGIRRESALREATHLGVAMQLTNICRDVLEDWQRDRLYLPDELLAHYGAPQLRSALGRELPGASMEAIAHTTSQLLDLADRFYESADRGMSALPWRAGLGVRAARYIYSDIGRVVRAQNCDAQAGRAVVSKARKVQLAGRACLRSLLGLPRAAFARVTGSAPATPTSIIEYDHELIRL